MAKEQNSDRDNRQMISDYDQCPSKEEKDSGESSGSIVNTQTGNVTTENGMKEHENKEDAESYVKSVMSQSVVTVAASNGIGPSANPIQALVTRTGRKRHLSMPNVNESNVKKVKSSEVSNIENTDSEKFNSEKSDSETSGSEKSKQERVTLRVRRNILPNKERLKTTTGKDKKTLNKNDGGNEPSAKPKQISLRKTNQ